MILQCKNCGGKLTIQDDQLTAKCDSCGQSQLLVDPVEEPAEPTQYTPRPRHVSRAFKEQYQQCYNVLKDADKFFLSTNDLTPMIRFLEEAGDYKDSKLLLEMAKLQFAMRADTHDDCMMGMRYLESAELTPEEKEALKDELLNKSLKLRTKELIADGFAVGVPNSVTEKSLVQTVHSLLNALKKDASALQDYEQRLVEIANDDAVLFVESNGEEIAKKAQGISSLQSIKRELPLVAQSHLINNLDVIMSAIEIRLAELTELAQQKEAQRKAEAARQKVAKKKQRNKIILICIVAIAVAIGLFAMNEQGYSASKIHIEITEKENLKFNETLVSGNVNAGYFYGFVFQVENRSKNDIDYIKGIMEIFNANGDSLAVATVELQGGIAGKSEQQWNVQLQVDKGDDARELWNTDLEDLKITFRIKTVYFSDGMNKSYSDTKAEIVHFPK